MTKQETIQIITLLAGNYNSIAEKDKKQKELMINTWFDCLIDLDYDVVLKAVKKTIIESPYTPTIHDIRRNVAEITNPSSQRAGIEAWNEAYEMIRKGTYMTQEEFDKHSPEVRKFFGGTAQLRAYSTNTDFNMDVVRSNFLKQYDILVQREKQQKLLPKEMQELIGQVSKNLEMIGG